MNCESDIVVKKAKGRPKKIQLEETEPIVLKKRGRKKVEKEPEIKTKKKRGRKAVVKFYRSSIRKRIPLGTMIEDNDRSILHLDIKEKDIKNEEEFLNFDEASDQYSGSTKDTININSSNMLELDTCVLKNELAELLISDKDVSISDLTNLYEKRLKLRLSEDNLLLLEDPSINEKSKDTSIKNIEKSKIGYFSILDTFYENPKWSTTTDICCWWCCHSFKGVPLGLPIRYTNRRFNVRGLYCSFACMLSYNDNDKNNKNINTLSLIKFMYKKLTGITTISNKEDYVDSIRKHVDLLFDKEEECNKESYIESLLELTCEKLQCAPPRSSLKIFGGELSIDEFRNSSKEHKIYKLIEYPMCISRDYIEEVDIQNVKTINMNVFSNSSKHNLLDDKKVQAAKNRVQTIQNNNSNVVTSNNIDKFIKFN